MAIPKAPDVPRPRLHAFPFRHLIVVTTISLIDTQRPTNPVPTRPALLAIPVTTSRPFISQRCGTTTTNLTVPKTSGTQAKLLAIAVTRTRASTIPTATIMARQPTTMKTTTVEAMMRLRPATTVPTAKRMPIPTTTATTTMNTFRTTIALQPTTLIPITANTTSVLVKVPTVTNPATVTLIPIAIASITAKLPRPTKTMSALMPKHVPTTPKQAIPKPTILDPTRLVAAFLILQTVQVQAQITKPPSEQPTLMMRLPLTTIPKTTNEQDVTLPVLVIVGVLP